MQFPISRNTNGQRMFAMNAAKRELTKTPSKGSTESFPFCCSYVSAGRLTTHINVTHMLHGQDYICHICAKQFACRSNLTYHLTTHQPRVHQVQCEKCGKWWVTSCPGAWPTISNELPISGWRTNFAFASTWYSIQPFDTVAISAVTQHWIDNVFEITSKCSIRMWSHSRVRFAAKRSNWKTRWSIIRFNTRAFGNSPVRFAIGRLPRAEIIIRTGNGCIHKNWPNWSWSRRRKRGMLEFSTGISEWPSIHFYFDRVLREQAMANKLKNEKWSLMGGQQRSIWRSSTDTFSCEIFDRNCDISDCESTATTWCHKSIIGGRKSVSSLGNHFREERTNLHFFHFISILKYDFPIEIKLPVFFLKKNPFFTIKSRSNLISILNLNHFVFS